MQTKKTIDVLNKLIELNNDRIEGYKTAAEETKDANLKALFNQFKNTSETCKSQLIIEVNRIDGVHVDGTTISGKFFRVWMDFKAALTGDDKQYILESCEQGEDVIKHAYHDSLKNDINDLSLEQQMLIKDQYTALKSQHDQIKMMRDTVAQ